MKKLAHYYYICGNEIQIFVDKDGNCTILDKDGLLPICPIRGIRYRHPKDGQEDFDEYQTFGLYYRYEMIGF